MSASSVRADAPTTYEEYLIFEQSVDSRHEFIDGDILAMAGGTRRHAVLKSRLSTELTIGFGRRGSCHVEDSDTRVVVDRGAGNLSAYYPDMVVLCEEGETHPRDREGGLINPTLLVEVTSRSTEKRDRGVKLDDYRLIPSLREFAIVSHIREELELWSRDDAVTPWTRRVYTAGDMAELRGVRVAVSDLYRDPLPER
jgi:Uma2 family endonuclease